MMHIQDTELEKVGMTREQVADVVRTAILAEDYSGGLSVRTHRTCSSIDCRLETVKGLYSRIEAGRGDLTNLLEDAELREKGEEAVHDAAQSFDADAAIQELANEGDELTETETDELHLFANGNEETIRRVVEALAEAEWYLEDAADTDDLVGLLYRQKAFAEADLDNLRERVEFNFNEAPAYWTIYWRDEGGVNVEAAQKAFLVAFSWEDEEGDLDGEYLALGGCGMDLSPRLDAYLALAYGVIPEDSNFFRQPGYFRDVAGAATTDEVDQKTRLEVPELVLNVPLTR